jgi:hypothetical protein
LKNGRLLEAAEAEGFGVLVTGDVSLGICEIGWLSGVPESPAARNHRRPGITKDRAEAIADFCF